MNSVKTHIIGTYGGPLVMLPKARAGIWQGCVDLQPEEHYSLACSQQDYLSVLPVEDIQTIILGDEPLPTFAAHKQDADDIFIFRTYWVNDESRLDSYILNILDGHHEYQLLEEASIFIDDTEWVIFDSAVTFEDKEDSIEVKFTRNNCMYKIQTYLHETPDASFLIHSFTQNSELRPA